MVAIVTIGFVKDATAHIDVQGFNVYHKNRLIKVSGMSLLVGFLRFLIYYALPFDCGAIRRSNIPSPMLVIICDLTLMIQIVTSDVDMFIYLRSISHVLSNE